MSRQPAGLATEVQRLRRLLRRPDFRRENLALLQDVARLRAAHPKGIPGPEWDAFLRRRVVPFAKRWKAWPSIDPDLFRPARSPLSAMLSGQWGVVPVFAWTTDAELRAATRRVRQRIGRRHQDARTPERAMLSRWLETNGIPRREIPRLLGWRADGADRPTAAATLAHVSEARLQAMIRRLVKRGWSEREARREVVRRLRGTEVPASRMVRLSQARFDATRHALEAALIDPPPADALSATISRVVRARVLIQDEAELMQELKHAVDKLYAELSSPARS
jgi:hypothetical protein